MEESDSDEYGPLHATWAEQSKVAGYSLESLNALSAPKGVRYTCELTGSPAEVKVVTPFLTLFYASRQDAVLSWEGVVNKLLPLLSRLRAKPSIVGSEEERQKREYSLLMSKRALVDLTMDIATKFLVKGEYHLGIPGAVQCLAFSREIYGQEAVQLVPSYLLLAQCNLGLGQLRQVQEFLGLANWAVLKQPDCSAATKSQLHRTFGKLCAAQGKLPEAATHLAKDIYWMSREVGPEHVRTTPGYFHLAAVFDQLHRVEAALAFFDKVVDVWFKHLSAARAAGKDELALSEAQCEEALQMLGKTLATREQFLGENHIATGEAHFTLGLLRALMGGDDANASAAKKNVAAAHRTYVAHLGADHPSTVDVHDVLSSLQ